MLQRTLPKHLVFSFLIAAPLVTACEQLVEPGNDAGMTCPDPAPFTCTEASCSATTGTKTFGASDLSPDVAARWSIVSWDSSELNDTGEIALDYVLSASGALTARRKSIRSAGRLRHDARTHDQLYAESVRARVLAEAQIRALASPGLADLDNLHGSGIKGRSSELLPDGVHKQEMMCSEAAPDCGAQALCIIPEGATDGNCESALTIKLHIGAVDEDITATVMQVGARAAIVVDDRDTVLEADATELLKRFDEHIGPRDHQFFGEPINAAGRDRDGNGVIILFFTSKVRDVKPNVVGFFFPDDMQAPSENADSNGADLLYLLPPGGSISLDGISGTLAHEYQHLINYYAKVENRGSSQESAWLDEGLSTFAEDVAGYGSDSFKNIGLYLDGPGDTSLTGTGLIAGSDDDTNERRGMAHLLVRYIYERAGAAEYPDGPGEVTDLGGVAAVRALVQTADTGVDVISTQNSSRSLHRWLGDMLTAVALDGTGTDIEVCNAEVSFEAPETDAYTQYQRGIDLRDGFDVPGGSRVTLQGPATADFTSDNVPLPTNSGEFRTLSIGGETSVSVGGPAEDYEIELRALPLTP